MERIFIEDETFEKKDVSDLSTGFVTYDNCTFKECNFSGVDLSMIHFMDGKFTGCDISNAKLHKTALRNIHFNNCKMIGLLFDDCEDFLFEVNFENCILNFSSFARRKMKNTRFLNCSLVEVDFTMTDLTGVKFENCNLSGARFENTNLEKADLHTSFNFSINPELNKLKKAKFSLHGLAGLLDKYGILIEN